MTHTDPEARTAEPDQAAKPGHAATSGRAAEPERTAKAARAGGVSGLWRRLDRAAGGLAADLALYGLAGAFAAVTAVTSTLLPHRAWGAMAAIGYLVATLAVAGQLALRRRVATAAAPTRSSCLAARLTGTPARAALTAVTWCTTALLPLLTQAVQRANGRTDRAQEEVLVIEQAGIRLVEEGTPYLGRDAILALPADERLLGYVPYQPGMALFGLPRALAGATWWTDARPWFALVTAGALLVAAAVLRRRPITGPTSTGGPTSAVPGNGRGSDRAGDDRDSALLRAAQFATVLPVCALTLATGGDDLPVLALCLLALALLASRRPGAGGLAIGVAAALKLFAWPIALVLLVHAACMGRRSLARFAAGALGVPVAALLPALLVDPAALVENVLRFPLGQGVVTSPAQSPFPGYLIATTLPAGRAVATALLLAAGLAIAVWLARRPPRTAATAAAICGYGLLAAILLMPATRFGYLLYPLALLAAVPALTSVSDPALPRPAAAPTTGDGEPGPSVG